MLNINQPVDAMSVEEAGAKYRAARDVRLAMEKEVALVKAFEAACKDRVIALTPVDTGFVIGGYSYVVTSKERPALKDWTAFYAWTVANGRSDCIEKRPAAKAITDTENWKTIPGIECFNAKDLSVTKK